MRMKLLVALVSDHSLAFLCLLVCVCVLVFHPLNAMGLSVTCDCGNYWSYSLDLFVYE